MTERVELHLHTTASDDISVISPKGAIKAAMQTGHKAVAVTCSSTGTVLCVAGMPLRYVYCTATFDRFQQNIV
jgi:hypothetical protein